MLTIRAFLGLSFTGGACGVFGTMIGVHRTRYCQNLEIRNQLIQENAGIEYIEAYNRWLKKGFYSQLTSDPQLVNKKKRRLLTSLTKKKQ